MVTAWLDRSIYWPDQPLKKTGSNLKYIKLLVLLSRWYFGFGSGRRDGVRNIFKGIPISRFNQLTAQISYFLKICILFKHPDICKTFRHSLILTRDRPNVSPPDIWLHTEYPVDRALNQISGQIPDIRQNIRPDSGHPARPNSDVWYPAADVGY